MSKVRIIVLFVLFACSEKKKPEPERVGEDPARRLTVTECEMAVDHAIALLDADPSGKAYATQMRTGRDTHVAECVKTGTLRDHRCLMGSRNLTELGLCPMPGSNP